MALQFNNATSDRVRVEAASSINSMAPYTLVAWLYPTSLAADKRVASKLDSVAFNGWAWQFTSAGNGGNSGNMELYHSFSGTPDVNAVSNTRPLVVNRWNFIAASVDGSNVPRLYQGLDSDPIAECAYSSQVTGVGSPNNDSGNPLYIANEDSFGTSFPGRIATFMIISGRALSLGELRLLQRQVQPVGSLALWMELGLNGIQQQPDLAGKRNYGVVTGARVAGHPPRTTYQPRRLGFVAPAITNTGVFFGGGFAAAGGGFF